MIRRHIGIAAAHSKRQLPPGDIPRAIRVVQDCQFGASRK